MSKKVEKKEKFDDLGLGNKDTSGGYRTLNKNGSFNVRKTNVPFLERLNFFHALISMSWLRFFGLTLLCYFIANLLFATIYTLIGLENLTATKGLSEIDQFLEAFFFSAQTITTLGYGRVAPMGFPANSVAAVESLLGLLFFALATGMLYGRFSKPSAKIKYSGHAVIAPYRDSNGFMFRMVNPQSSQLLEVEVTVTLSLQRKNSDLRDFHLLELERSKVVFFPYTWTIVHPIYEESPLHELTETELIAKDPEFIVMVKAFDESFSQTVYSRSSYKASELRWGEKFVYLMEKEKNRITVDVGRLDESEKAALNVK